MDLQLCVRLTLLWLLALGRDSQGLTYRSGGSRNVQPYFNPVVNVPLRYSPPAGGLSADQGRSLTDSIPTGKGSPVHPNPARSESPAGYRVSHGGSSSPGSVSTYRPGTLISSKRIQLPLLFNYQTSTDGSQQPAVLQTKAGMWDIALGSSMQLPSARLNPQGQTSHWPPQDLAQTRHQQWNPHQPPKYLAQSPHQPPKYPGQTTHRVPQYPAQSPHQQLQSKCLAQSPHQPKPPKYLAQTSHQPKPPQYLIQTPLQHQQPPKYLDQNPQWPPKYLGQTPHQQQFPITPHHPPQHRWPSKYLVQTPNQHRQPPRYRVQTPLQSKPPKYLVQQPQLQYLAHDLQAPSEPEVNHMKTSPDSADQYTDLLWQQDQDHQFFNLY